MSGDRYFIREQNEVHFLTFTIVEWTDVFTRPEYKQIIVDSLQYCIDNKGLNVHAWVLMTNHIHIIASAQESFHLSDIIRDFKKFTSKKIVNMIQTIPESRRDWLLHRFGYAAAISKRVKEYKLWTDDNHAICLDDGKIPIMQKINYIHNNPVRQLIVYEPEHYMYSSAVDYTDLGKGLVTVIRIY